MEAPDGVLVPWDATDGLAAQCSLEISDTRQGMVEGFERAAVAYLDGYTGRLGRCILRQKWALPLVGEPDVVHLPFPDCRDFAVERLDGDNWTEVPGIGLQHVDDQVALSDMHADWTGLHLTCIAGWDTADVVPDNIKQAVRMMVAHWFDNRATVTTGPAPHAVPMSAEALISPYIHVFA